jgi:hypothetical protein
MQEGPWEREGDGCRSRWTPATRYATRREMATDHKGGAPRTEDADLALAK